MIAFPDPSLHETNSRLRVRRSIQELIQPTRQLAVGSAHLFYAPLHPIDLGGDSYVMPRFLFVAPNRGARLVRVGIFAGIHGDEIAGCHAALQLLQVLHENPELGRGYELFVYPVCNPTGYEDGTRFNRRGVDLNREFWKKSRHREVGLLEKQIEGLRFEGFVALHADDTSDGLYGFAVGSELTRHVLEPALRAAEKHLPRNRHPEIDGFPATEGIIDRGYSGILGAPPPYHPRPFEIVFETPQLAPLDQQVSAHVAALLAVLETHRGFISHGQDL